VKAQFKYSILAGLFARLPVFVSRCVILLVFGGLGSLGLLPSAAHITAVSLGGVGIAVMMAFDIIGDVAIARRMFRAPDAYLCALTPAPRRNTLLASLIAMLVMDFVSLAVVIGGEVWLSLNLAGQYIGSVIWGGTDGVNFLPGLWALLYALFGYLLIVLIILFCVTAAKSVLYKKAASGLLAFLLGCGCVWLWNLLNLVLAPFGQVDRFGVFFTVYLGSAGAAPLILLTALEAAGLFILTANLMERKMNI